MTWRKEVSHTSTYRLALKSVCLVAAVEWSEQELRGPGGPQWAELCVSSHGRCKQSRHVHHRPYAAVSLDAINLSHLPDILGDRAVGGHNPVGDVVRYVKPGSRKATESNGTASPALLKSRRTSGGAVSVGGKSSASR
jgi:hypothetical protein